MRWLHSLDRPGDPCSSIPAPARAVLLDSAPGSRSSSHSRLSSSNSTAHRAVSPATSPAVRAASPGAPFQRQPSRLSAVPPKNAPPRPAVRPPTSSFRIGKGTVPASVAVSRSNSEDRGVDKGKGKEQENAVGPESADCSSASTGSALSPGTSVSTPPSPLPVSTDPSVARSEKADTSRASPPVAAGSPTAVSPARQASSTSSASSSNGSSLHQSSSTRTSLSSAGSPLPDSLAPPSAKPESSRADVPKPAVVRGGVLKGKETLKKEKKKEDRAKNRVAVVTESESDDSALVSPPTASSSTLPTIKEPSRSPLPPKPQQSPIPAPALATAPPSPVVRPPTVSGQASAKGIQLPSFTKRASISGLRDEAEPESSSATAKKRRKLLNNVGVDDTTSGQEPRDRSVSGGSPKPPPSRAPTPASPKLPSAPSSAATHTSTSSAAAGKKRLRRENWNYSSSSDDDGDVPKAPAVVADAKGREREKKHRRTTGSSIRSGSEAEDVGAARGRAQARVPVHLQPVDLRSRSVGSPLRASVVVVSRPVATSAAVPTSAPASVAPSPNPGAPAPAPPAKVKSGPPSEYCITDAAMYETYRTRFEDGYKPYAELHARLMRERDVVLHGGKEEFDIDEVEKLVKRSGRERAALLGIKEAIAEWNSRV